ncbi:uncharacterized protein LOC131935104 [Physella acuta]|uniref:uncharacterized protein LOC131935104 n=1 Tax=Physella acuta TaxID=109671 RepID=UPI0027DDE81F|nr:uncharacterized protein LOC131935104 [Physella acuta]
MNGQHGHRRFSTICHPEFANLGTMIQNRIQSLDLSHIDTERNSEPSSQTISYVITNPAASCILIPGDIVYVIQPSSMCATPTKQDHVRIHGFSWSPSQSTPIGIRIPKVTSVELPDGTRTTSQRYPAFVSQVSETCKL